MSFKRISLWLRRGQLARPGVDPDEALQVAAGSNGQFHQGQASGATVAPPRPATGETTSPPEKGAGSEVALSPSAPSTSGSSAKAASKLFHKSDHSRQENKKESAGDGKSPEERDATEQEGKMYRLLISEEWKALEASMEEILREEGVKQKGSDFEDLSDLLRPCLLCCTAFPDAWAIRKSAHLDNMRKTTEDWAIKKRTLIYWWIGEGFVRTQPNDGKSTTTAAEEVGEAAFGDLVWYGLVEPIYTKRIRRVKEFKLHPLVRWMLIEKAKETSFFEFDQYGTPSHHPNKSTCTRSCLTKDNVPLYLLDQKRKRRSNSEASSDVGGSDPKAKVVDNQSQLTTLVNSDSQVLDFDKRCMAMLGNLKVLQIGKWHELGLRGLVVYGSRFLDDIKFLKQLRYLSLRGISWFIELPSSIQNLEKLEILDLRGCQNLERIRGVAKTVKHLDLTDCFMLEELPLEVGSLPDLEVLKGFVFGSTSSKTACRLTHLAKLRKLRKLTVNITSLCMCRDSELKELVKIHTLSR